jgi:DNA-binding cell septation regulator SpoVG
MTISINNIRIFPSIQKNGIVAYASAIINEWMYIGSIAIHEKKDKSGFRLTYPTRKMSWKDLNVYHPITLECSKIIEEAIIFAYLSTAKTVNNDWYYHTHTSDASL